MVTLSLIKDARVYNGEKTPSSISGAGKTGQLHVSSQAQRAAAAEAKMQNRDRESNRVRKVDEKYPECQSAASASLLATTSQRYFVDGNWISH